MCCLLSPALSDAAVPHLIRYQGQAVDSNGVPLEGPYTLTFRLYAAATGGTATWQEVQTNVALDTGHFSVLLGQVTSLDPVDWTQPLWLGVQVNTQPELAPRQQITSVPLAITAEKLAAPVTTSALTDDAKALVPAGAIILWTGASCPSGYARFTAMDNKFLVSGTAYNAAAGGSNTHTHAAGSYIGPSHTHSIPGTTGSAWSPVVGNNSRVGVVVYDTGVPNTLKVATVNPSTGTGGTGPITGTSGSADSRPEFATILLCQRQ